MGQARHEAVIRREGIHTPEGWGRSLNLHQASVMLHSHAFPCLPPQVKECTGNKRILAYTSRGINCWTGNDDEAHDARHSNGAVGVISVTSNVLPGIMKQLMTAPNPELNNSVKELIAWLFCEPNPIPLNTAMCMCGQSQPVFRLPYVPLEKARREKGAVLLRAMQQHIPGCQDVRVMEDNEFSLIGRY